MDGSSSAFAILGCSHKGNKQDTQPSWRHARLLSLMGHRWDGLGSGLGCGENSRLQFEKAMETAGTRRRSPGDGRLAVGVLPP